MYPIPVDRVVRAIERANRALLAQGVTSVQEAGIGGGWIGRTPIELAAYQRARDERCPRRAGHADGHGRCDARAADCAVEDDVGFGLDLGLRTGFGDDRLRIGAMKIFADGSLIGRTAAMVDDYAGEGGRGYFQTSPGEAARHDRPCAPFRVAGGHPRHR